jgi:pimeloyl-ACP methyl ester carboxylesterase
MMVADVGDPDGAPILYVAGYGHSRLARHPDDLITGQAGVRLLAIDPPGLGGSDPRAGYTLRTWTKDAIELADQLGIDRFAALGWSWGGPYALVLAHEHPSRVASIGLVSALGGWLAGPGRINHVRPEYRNFGSLCRWAPPLVRVFLARQRAEIMSHPQASQTKELDAAGPADQQAAAMPGVAAMLLRSHAEAWRQGISGMFDHGRAVTLPWGFAPADVRAPARIWQGGADLDVLPGMARYLADAMPQATLVTLPDEGHLLLFTHWSEILRAVATDQVATQAES